MTIRELIKQTRKEQGLSQLQFAKYFKTTANTVSRWESGKYEVPNRVLEVILSENAIEVICSKCMGTGMFKKYNYLGTKNENN